MDYFAVGEEAVARYLAACREPLLRVKELIVSNPEADDAAVRALYNTTEGIPTIREAVVRAVRKSVLTGEI
jgi:hypothetical protein